MEKGFRWPKTSDEIKEREASGFWAAQALAKEIAEGDEKITLDTILRIHRVFFQHANPDIAGRFRRYGEDVKKLKCIEPPLGTSVQTEMYGFWRELDVKLASIPTSPKGHVNKVKYRKLLEKRNDLIIDIATWTQHKIVSIHPFCEGNGRMARLMTNLILQRYGLQPTDIKYEGENKKVYLDALCKIDYRSDYRALRHLILKGIVASYEKLRDAQKKAVKK